MSQWRAIAAVVGVVGGCAGSGPGGGATPISPSTGLSSGATSGGQTAPPAEPWLTVLGAGIDVLVADFDGDGLLDLVTQGEGGVAVHFGPLRAGTIDSADAETLITGGLLRHGVPAVDIDGDGLPELPFHDGYVGVTRGLVADESDTAVLTFAGTEGLGEDTLPTSIPGDFDGDGWTDLLVSTGAVDAAGNNVGAFDVDYGPLVGTAVDPVYLAPLNANQGRVLVPNDVTWDAVWSVGDLDGDGYPELTTEQVGYDMWFDPPVYSLVEIGDLRGVTEEVGDLVRATNLPAWKPISDWDADGVPDVFGDSGIWSGAEGSQGIFADPVFAIGGDPGVDGTMVLVSALQSFDADEVEDLVIGTGVGDWAVSSTSVSGESALTEASGVGTLANMLSAFFVAGDLAATGTPDVVCGTEDGVGIWSTASFNR